MWVTISGLQLFVVPAVTGGGPSAPGWGPSSEAAAGGLAVEGGLQLHAGGLHHQQQLGGLAVVGGHQLLVRGLHHQQQLGVWQFQFQFQTSSYCLGLRVFQRFLGRDVLC